MRIDTQNRAIEKERYRVAGELHDDILPLLARLSRYIRSERAGTETAAIIEELHITVDAFRDLLGELRPVDLDECGMVPAIQNICQRYTRRTGRCVLLDAEIDVCPLTHSQQLALYRIIQALLQMFADSQNDLLLLRYECDASSVVLTARCVDRRVGSADWISAKNPEYAAFESWCSVLSAGIEMSSLDEHDYPLDLVLFVATNPAEAPQLSDYDRILAQLDEEEQEPVCTEAGLIENLAIEFERQRILREIDRYLVPHLARIAQLAGEFNEDSFAAALRSKIDEVKEGINEIMSELRQHLLAETVLLASLRTLVDSFRRASLVQTTVHNLLPTEQIDISGEAKFAIYRVVQESLNNIEKHSKATRARIVLGGWGGYLLIFVEDNGNGIAAKCGTMQSRGLKSITERAHSIGATVSWEPAVTFESGTLVTIALRYPESLQRIEIGDSSMLSDPVAPAALKAAFKIMIG